MTTRRLTTYNPAVGEDPDYELGTGENLHGENGYIGSLCQSVKDSPMGNDFNYASRHILTGAVLKRDEESYTNVFGSILGYNHLWTGTRPNQTQSDQNVDDDPEWGHCLQIRTDKSVNGTYGLMMGDWSGHNYLERRWSCPIGLQFTWSNQYTNPKSDGIAMTDLRFYYLSKKMQVSQYTRLITRDETYPDNGMFIHPDSGTSGGNLLLNLKSEVGEGDKTGKVIAFVEPDAINLIKDTEQMYYLHGIEMKFKLKNDGQNYRKFVHFFNLKLLYDINVTNNSRVVVPQVHHRDSLFQKGAYPI